MLQLPSHRSRQGRAAEPALPRPLPGQAHPAFRRHQPGQREGGVRGGHPGGHEDAQGEPIERGRGAKRALQGLLRLP